MEEQDFFSKPIYKNSLLKVSNIVMLLVLMFLLIPLVLNQGNKELSSFHLILITCFLLMFMMLGDYIFRERTLPALKNCNFITENSDTPIYIKTIIISFLIIGLFFVIRSYGLIGLLYGLGIGLAFKIAYFLLRKLYKIKSTKIPYYNSQATNLTTAFVVIGLMIIMGYGVPGVVVILAVLTLLKITLAFFVSSLIGYLKVFRPNFYSYYRGKTIDFKIKYSINILSGIQSLILPLVIAFMLSDASNLLRINTFWILNTETLIKLGIVFLLMCISSIIVKTLELNSLKKNENWSDFNSDFSKKSGLIGIVFSLTMLMIFLYGGSGGFG